jgi:hypothetical protein
MVSACPQADFAGMKRPNATRSLQQQRTLGINAQHDTTDDFALTRLKTYL